jgi:hypothetical protein
MVKCAVDWVATIERNWRRSCSTLRIPRLRSSRRYRAIGQQNGTLFRARSLAMVVLLEIVAIKYGRGILVIGKPAVIRTANPKTAIDEQL